MQLNPTKISAGQLNSRRARIAFSAASVPKCGIRRSVNVRAVAEPAVAPAAASAADVVPLDYNQIVREGHFEAPLVQEQVCCSAEFAAVAAVVQSQVEMCMGPARDEMSGDPFCVVHTKFTPKAFVCCAGQQAGCKAPQHRLTAACTATWQMLCTPSYLQLHLVSHNQSGTVVWPR
jgi:hypothetical protein